MHILRLSFSFYWIVFYLYHDRIVFYSIHTTFSLSIYHLSDILVVSILAVVRRAAWTWLSRHLQPRTLSPLGMCQGVGQLDMRELCFCFSRILHTDFHKGCTSLPFHPQWMRVSCSQHLLGCLFLVVPLIFAILTMLKAVLIYISLVTRDDEKFLRHLLATPPPSLFWEFSCSCLRKGFFFFLNRSWMGWMWV